MEGERPRQPEPKKMTVAAPCLPVSLSPCLLVSLPQAEWHKTQLLDPARVEVLLQEYYQEQGFRQARVVVPSRLAERINTQSGKGRRTQAGERG